MQQVLIGKSCANIEICISCVYVWCCCQSWVVFLILASNFWPHTKLNEFHNCHQRHHQHHYHSQVKFSLLSNICLCRPCFLLSIEILVCFSCLLLLHLPSISFLFLTSVFFSILSRVVHTGRTKKLINFNSYLKIHPLDFVYIFNFNSPFT